jgi:hypothetical protein
VGAAFVTFRALRTTGFEANAFATAQILRSEARVTASAATCSTVTLVAAYISRADAGATFESRGATCPAGLDGKALPVPQVGPGKAFAAASAGARLAVAVAAADAASTCAGDALVSFRASGAIRLERETLAVGEVEAGIAGVASSNRAGFAVCIGATDVGRANVRSTLRVHGARLTVDGFGYALAVGQDLRGVTRGACAVNPAGLAGAKGADAPWGADARGGAVLIIERSV